MIQQALNVSDEVAAKWEKNLISAYEKTDKTTTYEKYLYEKLGELSQIERNKRKEFSTVSSLAKTGYASDFYTSYRVREDKNATDLLVQEEVPEGPNMCKTCKSRRIRVTTAQSRSGDEGMTNSYECTKCGDTWKINN